MSSWQEHDDYLNRKYEEKLARRDRLRMASGIMEFGGVVLGVVLILALLALLISLLNWLAEDISGTFAILGARFK